MPFPHPPPPVLALVGGIGAGKSAVATLIAEHVPSEILDADKLGHAALRNPTVRDSLAAEFGHDLLGDDGHIVRSRLAAKVFGDTPVHTAARARLEAITHPVIRDSIQHRIAELRASRTVRLILLDAAILLESGWSDLADLIVFVDTSEEDRRRRVIARGWSLADLQKRERAQWTLERKRAAAHDTVGNSDSLAETRQAVSDLLHRWRILPGA
jgi:dephospho-CoA kinase